MSSEEKLLIRGRSLSWNSEMEIACSKVKNRSLKKMNTMIDTCNKALREIIMSSVIKSSIAIKIVIIDKFHTKTIGMKEPTPAINNIKIAVVTVDIAMLVAIPIAFTAIQIKTRTMTLAM